MPLAVVVLRDALFERPARERARIVVFKTDCGVGGERGTGDGVIDTVNGRSVAVGVEGDGERGHVHGQDAVFIGNRIVRGDIRAAPHDFRAGRGNDAAVRGGVGSGGRERDGGEFVSADGPG